MSKKTKRQKRCTNAEATPVISKDVVEIPYDCQFLTLCTTQLPLDVTKYILSFLPYDPKLFLGVGLTSKSFYLAILSSWEKLKVNERNFRMIPSLVYRNLKCLVLDWFSSTDSDDIKKEDFKYIFDRVNPNLQRIEIGLRISSIKRLLKYILRAKCCRNLRNLIFSHKCYARNERSSNDLRLLGRGVPYVGNIFYPLQHEADWGVDLRSIFPSLSFVENPPVLKILDGCTSVREMRVNLTLPLRDVKGGRFSYFLQKLIYFENFPTTTRTIFDLSSVMMSLSKLEIVLNPSHFQYEEGKRVPIDRFQNLENVRTLKVTVYEKRESKTIFPLSALRSMRKVEELTLVDVYDVDHINRHIGLRFSFDDFSVISSLRSLKIIGMLDTLSNQDVDNGRLFTPELLKIPFPGGICGFDFPDDYYLSRNYLRGYARWRKNKVYPQHNFSKVVQNARNLDSLECCFRFTFMRRKEVENFCAKEKIKNEAVKGLFDKIISNTANESLFGIKDYVVLRFFYQRVMRYVKYTRRGLPGGARTMQTARKSRLPVRRRPTHLFSVPKQKTDEYHRNRPTKLFNLIVRFWKEKRIFDVSLLYKDDAEKRNEGTQNESDDVQIVECAPSSLELFRDLVERFISFSLISYADIESYYFRCSCGNDGCGWKKVVGGSLSKSNSFFRCYRVEFGSGVCWLWKKQNEKMVIVVD